MTPMTSRDRSRRVRWYVASVLTAAIVSTLAAASVAAQDTMSLSRTRHAGLDRRLRPGSFDYPFVFNLLGGYRLSPAWELSARLSFLSGRPFVSRVFSAGSFIGVLLMSTATLLAGPAQEPLRVGDRFPALKGQFLTGRAAVLPQASSGQIALVAIGFTYKSRFPVEAWAEWSRTALDRTTDLTVFEVPMIGGLGTLGRWFIDRGMRKGTPVELHDHVITVYGGTGDWKQRLSYSPAHEDDAYLAVLDREGVVRWLHHGGFDTSRADELKALLALLVRVGR
jgi:hypothetical protein